MAANNIKLFPNRIAALTSQTGIVGRFMNGFTQDVIVRAAIEAPSDSGNLSRSIGKLRETRSSHEIFVKIGSNTVNPRNGFHYARAQHTGARARDPLPGNPTGKMKFKTKRGRWVITSHVGPIPTDPYLTDALVAANATLPGGQKFRVTLKLDTRG